MLISAPDAYGMTPAETLAARADTDQPDGFEDFWREFREDCLSCPAHWHGPHEHRQPAGRNDDADPAGERALVWISSVRSIGVAGDLWLPSPEPRAIVVVLHGAQAEDAFPAQPDAWFADNVASLRLRVRGYPPSTRDCGDLRAHWIRHGLEKPEAWILRGAVADVVQAVRGCRRVFGDAMPIIIRGDSLGGGLAIIAAGQLAAMQHDEGRNVVSDRANETAEAIDAPASVDRMVIGLPSLGNWRWRAGRYCNGMGADINLFLEQLRAEAPTMLEQIRLFDAALHAPAVRCPVLTKLALCDDTVPAPSAAAVINALGSEHIFRHVVAFGHYDGGLADARRHVMFERLANDFIGNNFDARSTAERVSAAADISL
ncbi:MAG: acetylxylan esterase [Phycisphaerales bacterium]|nr:acetylxylan esterase [Phycisphaerales bacterium]